MIATVNLPTAALGSEAARVSISTGGAGCSVQLDSDPPGTTDTSGKLVLRDVDPTEHYVHVRCPQETQESVYFITPRAGENVQIRHGAAQVTNAKGGAPAGGAAGMPEAAPDPAEAKIKLRELIPKAVQLRAQARFDEAIQLLREAAGMDPGNSDLHRELGITFLLAKDWKRARIEMLEAIRHDPNDADAHNGLGYALEKLGEIEPALQEYRTATHLDPDDPSYRQHYLEALVKEAGERQQKGKKKSRI